MLINYPNFFIIKRKVLVEPVQKNIQSFHKFKKHKINLESYKILDFISFYLILVLLPKQILSQYIEIKVNQPGEQQVLSDDYDGIFPSSSYVDGTYKNLIVKKIQVSSESSIIRLGWNNYITNFKRMFSNLKNIIEIHINNLHYNGTIFSFTFSNCINLKKVTISINYNINYAIKDMSGMFYNCPSLISFSFKDLYLNYYFTNTYKSYYFSCEPCYNWVTYYLFNKINLSYMFYNCTSLKSITVDSYPRQNISDMSYMFYNCISLTSIDLEKFSTSNVLNIDLSYMFYNCNLLTTIKFHPTYTGVSNMSYMFYNCTSLTSINNLDKFSTGNNLNIDLSYTFYNCHLLKTIKFHPTYTGVSNMSYMFYNCTSLTSINNLDKFSTGNNLNIDLSYTFYNCKEIETIKFISGDKSFGINKIDYMFYNCSKLEKINLSPFRADSSIHLNMSYLFYNCQNLTEVDITNNYFYISDTIQMFYNCVKLEKLTFYPNRLYKNISMSKMFYNCIKLQSIDFNIGNSYFYPKDMSSMFYNCTALENLNLNKFNTIYLEEISYLLYNCTSLKNFNILSNIFYNNLIKDMRGIFQNCESIVVLDLNTFYTPNVEIMWDMFNGCSKLQNLNISNFDTSKVTDMQSMFKGCKSLSLLNLNHFNTTKVQYMNKMFENCQNLTQLNISQISSNSLSSMYRMFYNCKSLEYLNIYNLTEDAQSITEMFEGTPNNFIICIKDKENIPNIYNLIYNKITRDCKSSCYGIGNERNSSQNNKSCCTRYEYNNECYNKCPSKTKIQDSTNICKYFNCIYSFYNYEQNDCNDSIPDGFYKNDSYINTIDKCHEDCKTCKIGPNDYSTNCLICNDNKPYVYLGNCYANCRYGDFIDSNKINKCKCHRTKCEECTRESLKYDLCVSCNEKEGYYEKLNDSINISNFKNCYKDPENYYLNTQKKYTPCYHSCKSCAPLKPDKKHHYCKSCNEDNSFSISDENNSTYMNCYPECKYNYYFNETEDYNYTCTKTPGCPHSYPFLIENTKQCIETCQNFSKIWQFRHTCFEQCPNDSKNYTNSSGSYCNASCPFEKPFEMVETQ